MHLPQNSAKTGVASGVHITEQITMTYLTVLIAIRLGIYTCPALREVKLILLLRAVIRRFSEDRLQTPSSLSSIVQGTAYGQHTWAERGMKPNRERSPAINGDTCTCPEPL